MTDNNMTSTAINMTSLSPFDYNQSAFGAGGGDIQSESSLPAEPICHGQLLIDDLSVRIFLCIFYVVIFIMGVFGNTLVILVIVRNKSMQTPTNIFIVNMAVSDVLMCLFAVPFTPLHTFIDEWYFGDMLCKLFPTSQVRTRT